MNQEDLVNFLINAHSMLLSRKAHIKKYKKIRKLETDVTSKLVMYMFSEEFDLEKKLDDTISYECYHTKERQLRELELLNNEEDTKILYELCVYRNHPKLKSVVDIYLEKSRLRSPEKIKMLESLRDSFVGLFEIMDVDVEEGYVYIRDIFTKKQFKIVDIKMSTFDVDKVNDKYYYNRIITYDGISFGTGIACSIKKNNEELKQFMKRYKKTKYSDFSRCIILYNIYKNEKRRRKK